MDNLARNMSSASTITRLDRFDYEKRIREIVRRSPIEAHDRVKCVWHVFGGVHGKTATVVAGVHGNEHSGVWAMMKLMSEIVSGTLELKEGQVTFVLGNPEALKQNLRLIKYNLNRVFGRSDIQDQQFYECIRSREIAPFLVETDSIFDLHSTSSVSPPFGLVYRQNVRATIAMGLPHVVYGGEELFRSVVRGTTAGWSEAHGIPGFVFESGKHMAPNTFRNAYRYLRGYLDYMGVIPYVRSKDDYEVTQCYRLYDCQYLKSRDFEYVRDFQTLDWLKPGTVIGSYPGMELGVDRYSVVVMPTKVQNLQLGEEMFYLAAPTVWS
jgi:predicted deacylase